MSIIERRKLMKEYAKRFIKIFRILEISGFCRFIIRNDRIMARNMTSVLYNVFVMILINASVAVMWIANLSEKTLSSVDFVTIMHSAMFSNFLLCHITFGDKHRGPDLIENCIILDCYLDAKETKFMRSRTFKIYTYAVTLLGLVQLGIVTFLYYLFNVSIIIHVTGTLFFFWVIFSYDDFSFFLYMYWFVTTRVRYLNVALLKITKMDMEYIPKQWIFSKLFWHDEYDNRVMFHERSNKDFTIAFKILFNQLRHIQQCYSLPFFMGISTVIVGSFVAVQTFIMYIKDSTATSRASVVTGWVIGSWFYLLITTSFTDMFYKQIEHTKLICAYTQLNPTSSDAILRLTKNILATLELRNPRMSIYNLFDFDTGLILKVIASTFVYITVQLQLAFPNLKNGDRAENITMSTMFELDHNTVKEFLFLY